MIANRESTGQIYHSMYRLEIAYLRKEIQANCIPWRVLAIKIHERGILGSEVIFEGHGSIFNSQLPRDVA